ncbi:helix-turn-helix transcriptional regulator [Nakamurella sp. PAMC28650]|uniref:helix-turn-helix domain-containing protein n=1 Tax=Nakamurella sp. PAMC28650 TaxID=2762325 RepID=UPI00164E5C67|nr:helix-turn-helix transcriptional regulator [Nakamurella sp. PAMC28650]QNK81612.1 helix-turn-helix transcriptional regulator [Nakamurella sp. PAMC28650]
MTTSELDRRVGSRVRQALAARAISQAVLGASLHRSQGWISRRLRGDPGFTLAELSSIAMVLDVELDFFTGRLADVSVNVGEEAS